MRTAGTLSWGALPRIVAEMVDMRVRVHLSPQRRWHIRVHGIATCMHVHVRGTQYVLTCIYYTQDVELLFPAVHETSYILFQEHTGQCKLNHSKREDDVVTQAKYIYAPYDICTLDLLRVLGAGVGYPLNKQAVFGFVWLHYNTPFVLNYKSFWFFNISILLCI